MRTTVFFVATFCVWLSGCKGSDAPQTVGEQGTPAVSQEQREGPARREEESSDATPWVALTGLLGKTLGEVEDAISTKLTGASPVNYCRRTCPQGRKDDVFFACRAEEYETSFDGHKLTLNFENGRCSYIHLWNLRGACSSLIRRFGISPDKPPFTATPGAPGEYARWAKCDGNAVFMSSTGPIDVECFEGHDGARWVSLSDNYSLPKNVKYVNPF